MSNNSHIHKMLVSEAESQQLPKSFPNDLYKHDKKALEDSDNNLEFFGWILYESGTHILIPGVTLFDCYLRVGKSKYVKGDRLSFTQSFGNDLRFYVYYKGKLELLRDEDSFKERLQDLYEVTKKKAA